jgi:hypothetical protein
MPDNDRTGLTRNKSFKHFIFRKSGQKPEVVRIGDFEFRADLPLERV